MLHACMPVCLPAFTHNRSKRVRHGSTGLVLVLVLVLVHGQGRAAGGGLLWFLAVWFLDFDMMKSCLFAPR